MWGFEFANNFHVGAPIGGYFLIVNDEECVSALEARDCYGGRCADDLTQTDKFVAVGLVPCELLLGMASDLEIFKRLASVEVQDMNIPVVKECGGVLDTGSRGWSNNICT